MKNSGKDIVVNSVRIYDRWGELVHFNENLEFIDQGEFTKVVFDWSGEFGDRGEVEQGVYVYVIDMVVSGREEPESGDITVLR